MFHHWKFFFSSFTLFTSLSFASDYIVTLGSDTSVSAGGAPGDLRYTLNQILNTQAQTGSPSSHTIAFEVGSVTLTNTLPMINLFNADTIIIGNSSSNVTIDGNSAARPFFIRQGNVTLQNLVIQNGLAQGGHGGYSYGGGGMGAGGAIFIDEATVTLNNISLINNLARAGLGDTTSGFSGGGGGGLGGNGGNNLGGGGGYTGRGGDNGGGGGGAGDGGDGTLGSFSGGGGGGGGSIIGATGGSAGISPNGTEVIGYVFGGGGAGDGNTYSAGNGGGTSPGDGSVDNGGGGGGYQGENATLNQGGHGGQGGGGGGGSVYADSFVGGVGGPGGGGGGFSNNPYGQNYGGYGGGSGGGGVGGTAGFGGGGGSAGFGGGGGAYGGGGFGGGGGIDVSGGVGGTPELDFAGGDGAGFGGAIFVNTGTVIFQGNCSAIGNNSSSNGGAGASAGSDLFAVSGATLVFAPGIDNTVILSGTVADDSSISVPSGYTWVPGSGSGAALTMQGPGTLVLESNNSYIGTTTVTGGRLTVNGQISGGFFIDEGGILGGTGTIYGGGTVEGILSPGNSIGTITLDTSDGNVILTSSSLSNIEIDPSSSSKILITGTGNAILGGTVQITQDSGSYAASGSYTILEGPYTGEFDSKVLGGIDGYDFSFSYGSDLVYLLYHFANPGPLQISTKGLSGNALTTAKYLNKNASPSTLALFSGFSENSLKNAMNSVSPSRNAFSSYITQQTAFSLSALLMDHMDLLRMEEEFFLENNVMASLFVDASDRFQASPRSDKSKNKFSGWVSGFGEYANQKAELQNPAFNYISEAMLAGFDYHGENRGIAGGALGYAHTHFNEHQNAGHGNINYYFTSLYGNVFAGSFYCSPAVWGIFNKTENTRNISFPGFSEKAKADVFAWQFLPHLELGYDIKYSWGNIIPFSVVDWAISWQRSYHEEGASPFNASSKAQSSSMVRSETGFKFCEKWEYAWGFFFLKEKGSYVFQKPFGTGTVTTAFTGIPDAFTVSAVSQNLNLGDVGMDFVVAVGKEKPISINLGYEGEFGSKYFSNQLMLTLRKDF